MTMLDLDALVSTDRLPKVRLFQRELTVRPMTGAAAHRIATVQDADGTGASMLSALLDVVRMMVPELTAEEREQLSIEQISAIVQLSRGQINEVETLIQERAEKN